MMKDMTKTEELIQHLKNDDQKGIEKLCCSPKDWKEDIDFAQVYDAVKCEENASMQNMLGFMYQNGYGVPCDLKLCKKYWKTSAENCNTMALYNLGHHKVDKYKRFYYWVSSAKEGNMIALSQIAVFYEKRDTRKCIKYMKLAADQGHINSSINLAKYYFKNMENIEEACKYLHSAEGYDLGLNENEQYIYNLWKKVNVRTDNNSEENQHLKETLDEYLAENEDLKSDVYKLNSLNEQLDIDNQLLIERIKTLENSSHNISEENVNLRARIDELVAENEKLQLEYQKSQRWLRPAHYSEEEKDKSKENDSTWRYNPVAVKQ